MNEKKSAAPPGWAPLLDEYRQRVAFGRSMGGKEKLEKRRAQGRLNAREIVALFCDEGSFTEIGTLGGGISYHGEAKAPADALVAGFATVDGRPVVVGAEDFTVMGGSIGPATNAKKLRLARLAAKERVPYVMFLDGAGERMGNTLERRSYAPNDMQVLAELSGTVPTVAVVIGSSAGHGAITGLLMDFVVMLKDATLFSAGPPLVMAALGEKVSKEELGSARMHTAESGVAHNLVQDEEEACRLVHRYLGFLPSSAWQWPPEHTDGNPVRGPREVTEIMEVIPRDTLQPYDMQKVIDILVDDSDEWLAYQPDFGTSILTGLARMGGKPLGIVANQPIIRAGAITWDAADKAAHFLDTCNAYHLPVLFLADNPGVMSGSQAERDGTLRAAARMYAAQCRLRGPKFHVTLRKAFGFGSSLMGMNPFDHQSLSLALPGISLGAMPADSGGQAAKLDSETRQQISEAEVGSAWSAGDNLAYDEVVEPGELRNFLLRGLGRFRRQDGLPEPMKNRGIAP